MNSRLRQRPTYSRTEEEAGLPIPSPRLMVPGATWVSQEAVVVAGGGGEKRKNASDDAGPKGESGSWVAVSESVFIFVFACGRVFCGGGCRCLPSRMYPVCLHMSQAEMHMCHNVAHAIHWQDKRRAANNHRKSSMVDLLSFFVHATKEATTVTGTPGDYCRSLLRGVTHQQFAGGHLLGCGGSLSSRCHEPHRRLCTSRETRKRAAKNVLTRMIEFQNHL